LTPIVALDGPIAGGRNCSLADFHLAPMMAYLAAAPEGESLMAQFRKLAAWWGFIRERTSFHETAPRPPGRRTSRRLTSFAKHHEVASIAKKLFPSDNEHLPTSGRWSESFAER
jgi:hypothetical protein